MDKGFIKYIKEKKDITKIAIVIALGLVLIFIGGRREKEEVRDDTDFEDRLAAACREVEGVGACEVFVYCGTENGQDKADIESVIVICEGADSAEVRLKLTEMLSSFLGIGTNRIRVEKKTD